MGGRPHNSGRWAESHPNSVWKKEELPLLTKTNPKITQIIWVDANDIQARQAGLLVATISGLD